MEGEKPLSMSQLVNQGPTPSAETQAPDASAAPETGAAAEPAAPGTSEGAAGAGAAGGSGVSPEPVQAQEDKDDLKAYSRQLREENAQLRQGHQALLDKQVELMNTFQSQLGKVLQQQQPAKTPQEIEAQTKKIWEEINSDPDKFVQSRIDAKLGSLNLDDLAQKKVDALVEGKMAELAPVLRQLRKDALYKGLEQVGFDKVKDAPFRTLMESADNVKTVLDRFYKPKPDGTPSYDPAKLHDDPVFYERLYHAAEVRAQAAPTPAANQASQDQEALRRTANSQAVTGQTAGKNPGKPAAETPLSGLQRVGGMSQLVKGAKWS
jgi:hypothetical protein